MKTVMAFGEVLWDLLPDGAVLGGAPGNFAYRLSALGDRAWIVSRLGSDELGERAFGRLEELGMDTRFVQRDPDHPTGTVDVTVDAAGSPSFTIHPDVAYDHIEATDELLAAVAQADCICFGTLIQRASGSRRALHRVLEAAAAGGKSPLLLLDINLRRDCYTKDSVRDSLERATVLKLNEDELREIDEMLSLGGGSLPELCGRLAGQWKLSHCVVTLGGRGAFVRGPDGQEIYEPGYRIEVRDSCGSGDAFTAAFVHGLLRGDSLLTSLRGGNALGALVATTAGATEPIAAGGLEELLGTGALRAREPSLEAFEVPQGA